ncbi:Chromatin assembly factor 1 subunit rlf2 [Madurella fahalii]|uniref:Chromatin assembly factor 1 subunit rlf2 n=1 Tax=Madurella fahalii TaxID=1157608 RepID=A0ABQ0G8W9_9PEZI
MSRPWPAEMDPQWARQRQAPLDPASHAAYTHSRTRTTSSNTFPAPMQAPVPSHSYQPQMHLVQPQGNHQRRSPSVNTFSTVSSGGMAPPPAYRTSPTIDIRRSTSSRSGDAPGSPQSSGYVALLRKQKATVWCDRAQYEDPRLLAQQRAAKMRANREIVGSGSGLGLGPNVGTGRTSTGLSSTGTRVAAKIRHHGKNTVVDYSPGNNFNGVGGVPLRLSATEVEGEESDDDDAVTQRMHHRRTGSSGRNSIASGRRAMPYRSSGGLGPANSQGGAAKWSPGDTPERRGSLAEDMKQGEPALAGDDSASGKARSFGSGSSGERLDNVPDLTVSGPHLANNSLKHATVTREKSVKSADELRRRGSVDERTMTLGASRLYIANPD